MLITCSGSCVFPINRSLAPKLTWTSSAVSFPLLDIVRLAINESPALTIKGLFWSLGLYSLPSCIK